MKENVPTLLSALLNLLPDGRGFRAILVFGTPHSHWRVADEMANLHRLFEREFVVSGYNGEAEGIADLAASLGIPRRCMTLEPLASNTLENVTLSKSLFGEVARDSGIGLLAKDYAMVRTYLTALEAGLSANLGAISYSLPGASARKLKAELSKLKHYRRLGHIADPIRIGLTSAWLERLTRDA